MGTCIGHDGVTTELGNFKIDLLIRVDMSDWGGRGVGKGEEGGGGQRYGTDHPKLAFLRRSVTNLFSKGQFLTETRKYARCQKKKKKKKKNFFLKKNA